MNVGLYFGSFNPIHLGHLIIANHVVEEAGLDEVWFIISPQNPFKKNNTLLNENHRLHMVRLAIEGSKKLRVNNIEFSLPRPSYTCDTLIHLQERYPSHVFSLIIGSDGYQNIGKWKNANYILNNFQIMLFMRPGFEETGPILEKTKIISAPLLDISATQIRYKIKHKKSIRYLVPDIIMEEIKNNGYYNNALENPSD